MPRPEFDTLTACDSRWSVPCDGDVAALSRAIATANGAAARRSRRLSRHRRRARHRGRRLDERCSPSSRRSSRAHACSSTPTRAIAAPRSRLKTASPPAVRASARGARGSLDRDVMHERLVLMIDDKSRPRRRDLLPATVIAFGRGSATIRRVGSRIFVAPGMPARSQRRLVLDRRRGRAGVIGISLCDIDGTRRDARVVRHETRAVKMKDPECLKRYADDAAWAIWRELQPTSTSVNLSRSPTCSRARTSIVCSSSLVFSIRSRKSSRRFRDRLEMCRRAFSSSRERRGLRRRVAPRRREPHRAHARNISTRRTPIGGCGSSSAATSRASSIVGRAPTSCARSRRRSSSVARAP